MYKIFVSTAGLILLAGCGSQPPQSTENPPVTPIASVSVPAEPVSDIGKLEKYLRDHFAGKPFEIVALAGDALQIKITDPNSFEKGSSKLSSELGSSLIEIAMALNQYPELRVIIAGHTDNLGNAKHNVQLSIERANAVGQALIQNQVKIDRLEAQGFGSSQPIADNATEQGRAKNRRVEIFVLPKKSP